MFCSDPSMINILSSDGGSSKKFAKRINDDEWETVEKITKVTAKCEIYSIKEDSFAETSSMLTPRCDFTAAQINDKIIVTGGITSAKNGGPGPLISSAEIFNVQTESWEIISSLPSVRTSHCMQTLATHVVVIGGFDNNGKSFIFSN